MHHCLKKVLATMTPTAITLLPTGSAFAGDGGTTTPIKHVVVIFQENVSFDHYFGTYPHAANLAGEIAFRAKESTPRANTLEAAGLLTNNPNSVQPFRIPPSVPVTCDEDHNYNDEQAASDGGLMDKFVERLSCKDLVLGAGSTMGYYDGNTVTAFWNYAQHFAMNDNSFSTTFGPSTPGALNLAAGNTFGAVSGLNTNSHNKPAVAGDLAGGSAIGDGQPSEDVCTTRDSFFYPNTVKNVGDLLNTGNVTWGFFAGGFDLTITNANGTTGCARTTTSAITGVTKADYIPHHEPFQYFVNTRNPNHLRPSSIASIGFSDGANHQYDIHDFFDASSA